MPCGWLLGGDTVHPSLHRLHPGVPSYTDGFGSPSPHGPAGSGSAKHTWRYSMVTEAAARLASRLQAQSVPVLPAPTMSTRRPLATDTSRKCLAWICCPTKSLAPCRLTHMQQFAVDAIIASGIA